MDADAEALRDPLIEMFGDLPPELRRPLTWDQGSEIAQHHAVTAAATTKVFVCHPGTRWQ